MSELAKSSRKAMKSKAHRLTTGDPHAKVDASSWTPPEPLDTTAKTGARPVRGRRFKHGGKVHGEVPKQHAGRKPRKSGGRAITADSLLNRDMVEANAERKGIKHIGAFKKGGKVMEHDDEAEDKKLIKKLIKPTAIKTGKADGGMLGKKPISRESQKVAESAMKMASRSGVNPYDTAPSQSKAYKSLWNLRGGKPEKAHGGEIHASNCRCAKCGGGRMGKMSGGETKKSRITPQVAALRGMTPLGVKPSKKMKEDWSMEDYHRAHGPHATKARFGTNMDEENDYKHGGRTKRAHGGKIHAEAVSDGEFEGTRPTGGRLAKRHGGGMKGPTIIKIDVGTHKQHPAMGGMPPGVDGDPFKPSLSAPLPPGLMPPGGMPPSAGGPPPPPMMPPGAGAPPMGGLPPGLMGRKTGGRVKYPIKDGAGGGLGRLQKIKAYGLKPA